MFDVPVMLALVWVLVGWGYSLSKVLGEKKELSLLTTCLCQAIPYGIPPLLGDSKESA